MLYYIDLIVDVILGVILYRCYIILDVMHYVILYRFNTRSSPQENICTGRPAPTRTPAELQSPADMRTPVKHAGDSPQPEPWTPTANLKMLISAASPDIRRMRKVSVINTITNTIYIINTLPISILSVNNYFNNSDHILCGRLV